MSYLIRTSPQKNCIFGSKLQRFARLGQFSLEVVFHQVGSPTNRATLSSFVDAASNEAVLSSSLWHKIEEWMLCLAASISNYFNFAKSHK